MPTMRRGPAGRLVSKPFGSREGTVWVAFDPRRMQTRKEVNEMHAAITRVLALSPILAALAAVFLSLVFAPVEPSIVPPDCPPLC